MSGMVVLALGVTLSTKTGLGVSTTTAIPYAISGPTGIPLSLLVFVIYLVMIALQFFIKGKNRQWRDLLQLPVNMGFSAVMGWFESVIHVSFSHLWQNLLLVAASVILTGMGIVLTVNMQLVPNPPDGLAKTMSVAMKRKMGFAKNTLDFICVAISAVIDLVTRRRLISVGLGTVLAMIFIGRVVAVFNRLWKVHLMALAGVAQPAKSEKHLDAEGKAL